MVEPLHLKGGRVLQRRGVGNQAKPKTEKSLENLIAPSELHFRQ